MTQFFSSHRVFNTKSSSECQLLNSWQNHWQALGVDTIVHGNELLVNLEQHIEVLQRSKVFKNQEDQEQYVKKLMKTNYVKEVSDEEKRQVMEAL